MTTTPDVTIEPTTHPKHGNVWRVRATQVLDHPIESVFPFFADAHNLEKLTPTFLKFNVLTPKPIDMHDGTEIRYKLKVRGLPIRWKTTILDWDPPHKFIDTQDSGPYQLWHHTHTFEPIDNNTKTLCKDEVLYKPKGWILTPLINRFFVERDVKQIFEYRFTKLAELFPPRDLSVDTPDQSSPEPSSS